MQYFSSKLLFFLSDIALRSVSNISLDYVPSSPGIDWSLVHSHVLVRRYCHKASHEPALKRRLIYAKKNKLICRFKFSQGNVSCPPETCISSAFSFRTPRCVSFGTAFRCLFSEKNRRNRNKKPVKQGTGDFDYTRGLAWKKNPFVLVTCSLLGPSYRGKGRGVQLTRSYNLSLIKCFSNV